MREANSNSKSRSQLFITKIEIVQKRSLMYFQVQKARSFLKIFVGLPTMVAGCRGILLVQ
jgi:DNA polymerase delta subunit 1